LSAAQATAAPRGWLDRRAGLLLIALMLGAGAAMFAANVIRFNAYRPGFDLAFYQQAIWNTLQGHPWAVSGTDFSASLLGTDLIISPVIVTLPFYALWQSPLMLYVVQCAVTALGALPVYWLARDQFAAPHPNPLPRWGEGEVGVPLPSAREGEVGVPLPSAREGTAGGRGWGLGFAALYLLYPPVQNAALTEFAFRPFAALGMLFTIYYFERGRWRGFWIWALFTLLTRSEMGLVLFLFGVYGLLKREPPPTSRVYIADAGGNIGFLPAIRWKHAASLAALGLVWFLAATLFIVPAFAGGKLAVAADTYGNIGGNLGEVARNLLTNPTLLFANNSVGATLVYLALLLLPFLFIPLLRPLRLLPALPSVLLNVLSRRSNTQLSAYHYYYQVVIVVFITWAAIGGLADIRRGNGQWARLNERARRIFAPALLGLMFLVSLVISVGLGPVERESETLIALTQVGSLQHGRWESAAQLINQIPIDAPVAAGNTLAPHLPPRAGLWLLQADPHYSLHPLDAAQYAIADSTYSEPKQKQLLDQLRTDPAWQFVDQKQGYVLYKRLTKTP
jgi:uncharacterized membrane protein